ncbi:MAG: hypothetical protein FWG43_03710 [Clostridiales bacterium]|nr:hypothetical protein [Clostridiales bacterium]
MKHYNNLFSGIIIVLLALIVSITAFASDFAAPVNEDCGCILCEHCGGCTQDPCCAEENCLCEPCPKIHPGDGLTYEEVMAKAIDPQSWRFQRDMTWEDWHDNTAFDWKVDGDKITPQLTVKGMLILVDFADRPFIVNTAKGSDLLANPQIGGVPKNELAQFWASYLNDPQDTYNAGANHGITIDGFWRENTQGRWQVELDTFGVYRMPYLEFQYGLDTSINAIADRPSGYTYYQGSSLITSAVNEVLGEVSNFSAYDFAIILHAGYAESYMWEEAGSMIFYNDMSVTDQYSARAKFEQMALAGFAIPTATWTWLDTHDPAKGGDGRGWWARATSDSSNANWTSWWAGAAIWPTGTSTGSFGGKTLRYYYQGETAGVASLAHEIFHFISTTDNTGANNFDQRSYAGYWDFLGSGYMGGFGGSHTRYEIPNTQGGMIPSPMLTSTKREYGFIDNSLIKNIDYNDLKTGTPLVTEVFARTASAGDQFASIYPDTLGVINNKIKSGQAALALSIQGFSDAKPQINYSVDWESDSFYSYSNKYNSYIMEVVQQMGYDSAQSDSGVLLTKNRAYGTATTAPLSWVVNAHPGGLDTIDYWTPTGPNNEPAIPKPLKNNNPNHLAAALFHAGTSVTPNEYGFECVRTSQRNTGYSVVVNEDGSVNSKSIADNTVNEYYDQYNGLHFYILDKKFSPGPYGGEILSYDVAVRHEEGHAVGGDLSIRAAGEFAGAEQGKYAKQTILLAQEDADAVDILRVSFGGSLAENVIILNNLVALENGSVSCEIYIKASEGGLSEFPAEDLSVLVRSETNPEKYILFPEDTILMEYTIAYDANGGTGAMDIDTILHGDSYEVRLSEYL